jgi:hypothetical protein
VPDGKPVIGFIPDLPNVLIATGHEGNGLTLVIHWSLYQFFAGKSFYFRVIIVFPFNWVVQI